MITNVLQFGSYVRTESVSSNDIAAANPFQETDNHNFFHSCAIPNVWIDLRLLQIHAYNHDTSIFRFQLPPNKQRLNLPVGCYLLIKHPSDAATVRPYAAVHDDDVLNGNLNDHDTGSFEILCKRYDEWGQKESPSTHFLFTKTDHSYRPPGIMSNYLHNLKIGEKACFQFNQVCMGSLGRHLRSFSQHESLSTLTMIAVGVGVAPMIACLRSLFEQRDQDIQEHSACIPPARVKVVLLYGVREVRDILMREVLEEWHKKYPDMFSLHYCVGSRWSNVHMGAKTKSEYIPPPLPAGFEAIAEHASLGWVNEEKIQTYGYPPSDHTLVVVCGLPGVYHKLCGPRTELQLSSDCALYNLGYRTEMVCKL